MSSTSNSDDFQYVNRIIVSETNESILLAATNSGIFKSTDGGATFVKKLAADANVEQILFEEGNFNIQYASIKGYGIVKSINAGESWSFSNNQLIPTGRVELAISPADKNVLFASVDGTLPKAYISRDKGENWTVFKQSGTELDLLGQGPYDNTIAAHPFNANSVYIGGVNITQLTFNGTESQSTPSVLSAYTENTDSFLGFINFGGTYLGGGMAIEDGTNPINVLPSDWCSIEVRFGAGKKQKAHRFTVGGAGSGVALANYIYKDYVEVPFEVWDMTNNRQLMISFRDQAENGIFDLVARDPNDDSKGREYFFVNAVAYSTTADANIAKNGGRAYKQLYFFWPTLAEGGTWNASNLPESKIVVKYGTQNQQQGTLTKISDAYGSVNPYSQSSGLNTTKIPGLHPDHHQILIIPGANSSAPFTMINTNDGGISISENSGTSFTMKINDYNTTQFYGVSKKHGANEYIGGMQDNGTWQSKIGESANADSYYYFRIGGDGFETVWNYTNPLRMMGSVYYNKISKSTNGGVSWAPASSGIDEEDGPFITRLATSKSKVDMVFAIGGTGIYKNTTFGVLAWSKKPIGTGWAPDGVSSSHHIEVSVANDNIVWAGAGMASAYDYKIFVSTNEGETFKAVKEFTDVTMNAYLSALATHPYRDSTAFALFSVKGKPKVLRTDDLGENWRDISGFSSGKGVSKTGFPDVTVNDLVVMPYNTDIIWVGTDIGMVETTDGGLTWHMLNSDLPFVSVYQMNIVDDQLVVATHGRGIWSLTLPELKKVPIVTKFKYNGLGVLALDYEIYDAPDSVGVFINNAKVKTIKTYTANTINSTTLESGVDGDYKVHVVNYIGGTAYESNASNLKLTTVGIESLNKEVHQLAIYPNPSQGMITFDLEQSHFNKNYSLKIVSLSGKEVFNTKGKANSSNQLDISNLENGQYVIMIYIDGKYYVNKILLKK